MRASGTRRRRELNRTASLPRGLVLVMCGALLTFVQTALELRDARPWAHILAVTLVAGIAVASEVDRHRREQRFEGEGDGRISPLSSPRIDLRKRSAASGSPRQADVESARRRRRQCDGIGDPRR